MIYKYKMKDNQGIMSGIMNMFSGLKTANNSANRKEQNSSMINRGFTTSPKNIQAGGAGTQPSEAIMQWATTAGIPTPSANMMKGIVGGGSKKKHNTKHRKHYKRTHTKKNRKTHNKRK
jgi:hypothetical protein